MYIYRTRYISIDQYTIDIILDEKNQDVDFIDLDCKWYTDDISKWIHL